MSDPTSTNARRAARARRRPDGGFTLVEIMVVIAILGLSVRLVTTNLGALVPATVLDSEANRLMGMIEYIRSEAQLQGKIFKVEFDLDRHRWRVVMPAEDRLVSSEAVGEAIPMQWQYLDRRVSFGGFHRMDGHTARSQVSTLVLDENGYTTGTMIYFRNRKDPPDDYVWTVQIYGLEPRSRLLTNVEGVEPRLEPVNASHFR